MTYTHHLPGRLRVRSAAIKQNPASAAVLEKWLRGVPGVRMATAKPLTGSILIQYDPSRTDVAAILAELHDRKWTGSPASILLPARVPARPARRERRPIPKVTGMVAKAVVGCLVEAAVERSVLAVVAAIL